MNAIWPEEVRIRSEFFDAAEHIVPAPSVHACHVVFQHIEHLFDFEGSKDVLDQDCGLDAADWFAHILLCHHEDIVPELGFLMILELWQVEIDS